MLRNRSPLAKRRQGEKDFAIFPMRQPILQLTPSQAASPTQKLGLQPLRTRTVQKLVSDRSR